MQYDKEFGGFQQSLGTVIKPEWATQETRIEKQLQKWAMEQNVPFLNLAQHFRKLPQDEIKKMHYRLDGHWTPAGNQFVAKVMSDWIKNIDLVEKLQ